MFDPLVPGYHLDVMDDHFVPNLTWGPAFVNVIAGATKKQVWVHLMVDNPEQWPDRLNLPGGSIVTVHIESSGDIPMVLVAIRQKGWLSGIALNPNSPVTAIQDLLGIIDHVT